MDRVLAGVALAAGGKILLVLSRKDATGRSGRWSIPKGRYEEPSDGNLFEAAARELKEETGATWPGSTRTTVSRPACSPTRERAAPWSSTNAIERRDVLLDPDSTDGEAMSGVGLFAPALALRLIRREQRPLVEAVVIGGGVPEATGAALASILDPPKNVSD